MNESNVEPLFGPFTCDQVESGVDESIVAHLEDALAAAKSGQVRGIAVTIITQSRSQRRWWNGEGIDLVSATALLHHRVLSSTAACEPDEDDWMGPAA